MSTSSKKKTQKKNDTIGHNDNNVAKVNTTGYKPLKDQPVMGHRKVSSDIAKRNKAEILKKEKEGAYKNVALRKQPIGVALRNIKKAGKK